MEEIIPDKRKLVGLVEQAYQGRLCLPTFQRDFVWRRDEVADLLRSILRRYYIGSLLLLRCNPENPPFAPECLRGARPVTATPRPEWLVLDGQQRLTALIYALIAPDLLLKDSSQRRWFFVDLRLLLDDFDNDEVVFDRSQRDLDGLDEKEAQYRSRILPCTVPLRADDFLTWRDGLDDWLREYEPENHGTFRSKWRDAWTKAVTGFQNFDVPLVELPTVSDSDSEAIARVCAIFEKLNSTGVELSVYDLLTARLYRSGLRLHDLWDAACKHNKRLAAWSNGKAETNKFAILVLRTLALLRDLDPKPRFLINLRPAGFEADWQRAAQALERALELVEHTGSDGFGAFDRKWLPYYGLLPVIAALRAEIEERSLGADARRDLRRLYWCNVFLERYSSAVESKSRKDYSEMLAHWTEGKAEPTLFAEARARIGTPSYSIRDSASFASSVYSGVFCLLALRGARDWRLGESIQLQDLEDHHIFPQAYLGRHGIIKRTDVNSVTNRTLISDETNARMKDDAPATYLERSDVFAGGDRVDALAPHFIDSPGVALLRAASEGLQPEQLEALYEEFRTSREAAIVAEIQKQCF
ncbi:MAG TPA: DUF262 domain-containing protein [Thermoanaerobaculia bacterium]|jgi:hypothetical protein|nr:DUF262 domain-containing protein [Thermoanaerobaculia bacterium]